jgi:hypothetical protein
MIKLMIAQFETELVWLSAVECGASKRKRAKHPEYAESNS